MRQEAAALMRQQRAEKREPATDQLASLPDLTIHVPESILCSGLTNKMSESTPLIELLENSADATVAKGAIRKQSQAAPDPQGQKLTRRQRQALAKRTKKAARAAATAAAASSGVAPTTSASNDSHVAQRYTLILS